MPSPEPGLFAELKRRNVFRVAAMYAVAGWLLIQIGEATFEALGLPEGSLRLLILGVALGFPVAVVVGWLFDWTSEGLVRTPDDPEQEVERLRSRRRIDFAIIGVLVLALGMSLFGPQMETAPAKATPIRSIAVLPLANLSGDPDQDYFSDGMTDTLITNLARVSELRVIGRTSMMTFKGTDRTIPEIAEQLEVDGVIEGSAIREGNRMRISVQLIDARSGENVWAESYERAFGSALDLQREVAGTVTRLIEDGSPEPRARATDPFGRGVPVDPEALESYLRAVGARQRWENEQAIEFFQAAILAEPDFALAHLGLAHELATADVDAAIKRLSRSIAAANRALELDPTLDTARSTRAYAQWLLEHDWSAAEAQFRRSDDDLSGEYLWVLLLGSGRAEEALEMGEQHLERDPINLRVRSTHTMSLLFARRFDEVIDEVDQFAKLQASPTLTAFAYRNASTAAFMLGKEEDAYRFFQSALELSPFAREAEIVAFEKGYTRDGIRGASRSYLAATPRVSVLRAAAYACQGEDSEAALRMLEAASFSDRAMMWTGTYPTLDCIRDDPRFAAILRKINWPGLQQR